MPRCSLQLLLRLILFVHIFKLYFIFQNSESQFYSDINYETIHFMREEENPKAKSILSNIHQGTGF